MALCAEVDERSGESEFIVVSQVVVVEQCAEGCGECK